DVLDLVEAVLPVDRGGDLETLQLQVDSDQLANDVIIVSRRVAHAPAIAPYLPVVSDGTDAAASAAEVG
ncbi:MAG: hypothetical protein H7123_04910, partial [Thermoleophilia bacterium]|nr:hypothetical protein [Thermoleophilia bacterium]